MATKPKAKAKATDKAVALFGEKTDVVPAHLQTEAPTGNENVTAGDMATPRLNLLQAISEEVATIEEAEPGLFYNSVTGELHESVNVLNLMFEKDYAVFKLRKLGGGLEGNFSTLAEANAFVAEFQNPEDYQVVDTDKHYCLLLDDEGHAVCPVLLYMSGSKLKVSKNWNSEIQLKGKNADRFAGAWHLTSKDETNKRNERYKNIHVDFAGWIDEELHAEAKKIFKSLIATPVSSKAEAA